MIASLQALQARKSRIAHDKYTDLRSCVVDIADQMCLFDEFKQPVSRDDKERFFNALFQAETISTVAG